MIAIKKAQSAAKELAGLNQWASAGLMLGVARQLETAADYSKALELARMSQASALHGKSKDVVAEVIEVLKSMSYPPQIQKPGLVASIFKNRKGSDAYLEGEMLSTS
jgi:predicted RNase H-related nuclease YkuK (DUF458 family)